MPRDVRNQEIVVLKLKVTHGPNAQSDSHKVVEIAEASLAEDKSVVIGYLPQEPWPPFLFPRRECSYQGLARDPVRQYNCHRKGLAGRRQERRHWVSSPRTTVGVILSGTGLFGPALKTPPPAENKSVVIGFFPPPNP